MGIHVVLDIEPRGIDAAAWARVYEETLALLEAWRPRLLGWGARTVEGVPVCQYARSIRQRDEDGEYWAVLGDRESLQTSECQMLFRDLSVYRRDRSGHPVAEDIVVAAAGARREDTSGAARVFGNKTQGLPFHHAVLAAAMVVEERFPRHAMVRGGIDRGQAERARALAAPILGRDLSLPVRVDAPRLIERLRAAYDPDALAAAFDRVYVGLDDRREALLRAFPGDEGARQWKRELAEYDSPGAAAVVRLLIAWLNTGRDLRDACRFACIDPAGPRFSPDALVDALASTWVAVPREAREPLEELRKPEGESHTVSSLLGFMVLDTRASGRHLDVHIDPARIEADLVEVFGERGALLAARFVEQSTRLEAELRGYADGLQGFVERSEARAGDDTQALATLPDPAAMGPNQNLWLRVTTWSVTKLRESTDRELASALSDVKVAKSVLARVLSERGPPLTEDGWDAVVAEQDIEVLRFWIALVGLRGLELHGSQVRRALFENPTLLRHAMALARDRSEMRKVEALIEEERARKAGAKRAR